LIGSQFEILCCLNKILHNTITVFQSQGVAPLPTSIALIGCQFEIRFRKTARSASITAKKNPRSRKAEHQKRQVFKDQYYSRIPSNCQLSCVSPSSKAEFGLLRTPPPEESSTPLTPLEETISARHCP
jgi:hypothetical protein